MSVVRFTAATPCPVCGGHERLPRGRGVRCAGFASGDGVWAHCERIAGGDLVLDQRTTPPTYVHRIGGSCRCGEEHAPAVPHANGSRSRSAPLGPIVATFDYLAADGALLYQVVRHAPKDFLQRRPNGSGGWVQNVEGVALVPYRLPEMLAGNPEQTVFVVEGEKDVDRLVSLGLSATTNSTGADHWKDELSEHLRGRRVVILPDNDEAGQRHAQKVARSLARVDVSARILELPGLPAHGDVSDWLDAGHRADELLSLVAPSPAGDTLPPAAVAAAATGVPWQTAAEIAAATPAEVDWLWRDYLAAETVVELDGKLKSGKTTFNAHLIAALLDGKPFLGRPTKKTPVVYLTEEGNRTFRSLLVRAHLTGRADLHVLSKRRVPGLTWEQLVEAARAKLIETGARILYVDTLGKLAGFKDDDENSAGKAASAMNPLQALASELKIVVLCNRHDRKSGGEVGESARGSTAIGGDVDVIVQISKVGGAGREKRRCLRAVGRFDETPAELTIELTEGGYQEVSGTEARDAAAAAVLGALPQDEGDAVALVELLEELKELGHSRTNIYAGADLLVADGRARKDRRKGPSGHPRAVYWKHSSSRGDVALDEPFLISPAAGSSNEQDAPSKVRPTLPPYKGELDVGWMRPVDVESLDSPGVPSDGPVAAVLAELPASHVVAHHVIPPVGQP